MLPAPTPAVARAMVVFGLGGFVVSWACFAAWGSTHGLAFVAFWREALLGEAAGVGLAWDLVFSGLAVTALAVGWRRELGGRWLAAVLLGTWVAGVCVGLAALGWGLHRAWS